MAHADNAERTLASASRALEDATDLVAHSAARAGDTVQKAALKSGHVPAMLQTRSSRWAALELNW